MPMRVTRERLSRVALGLMSGALSLSVLVTGAGGAPAGTARAALAQDLDCYNDKDLYNLPECVERRALDRAEGNQPRDAQAGPQGDQPPSNQESAGQPSQEASGPPGPSNPPAQQASSQPSAPQGGDEEEEDEEEERPRPPLSDPRQAILTIADAGKEAVTYKDEDGSDKWGRFANTRFERDRSNGASALGPNVIDTKIWLAKDVESAKQLFKEQAAVKNFPERKEGVKGPVEKIKPTKYGEEFAYVGGYWQDDKVWQHWRFVIRQGNVVAVLYLFGREEFFQDNKDKNWTGQGDWFTSTIFHRM